MQTASLLSKKCDYHQQTTNLNLPDADLQFLHPLASNLIDYRNTYQYKIDRWGLA
jgi:hypothetical protein